MKFVNYRKIICGSLFLTLFLVSIQAQSKLSTKDIEAIKQVEETFRTAWLKNDEKAIMSVFTEDASLYPSTMAPVKGKDELSKFWFTPSDSMTTITKFEQKIEEVSGSKNYATLIGSDEIVWTTEKKDQSETKRFISNGHFITVFVKLGKDWKMLRRFANGKTQEVK